MTKIIILISAFITVLSFTACTSTMTKDIEIRSAASEKVNMDGYKKYTLLSAVNILLDEKDSFKNKGFSVHEYIQKKVHTQLLDKGKTYSSMEPDFFVSYSLGIDMDKVKEQVDEEGKKSLENIPEASLSIVFIDAHTSTVIWIATAEANIEESHNDEETKKRIDFAIKEMFKNL